MFSAITFSDNNIPRKLICSFRAYQEKKKATAAKPFEAKRTRRDRKDLENILFKLFERQPNWSLKHLMQETDQPEVFRVRLLESLTLIKN
jgi:transcription initiation factor TFIIF subunit beta